MVLHPLDAVLHQLELHLQSFDLVSLACDGGDLIRDDVEIARVVFE